MMRDNDNNDKVRENEGKERKKFLFLFLSFHRDKGQSLKKERKSQRIEEKKDIPINDRVIIISIDPIKFQKIKRAIVIDFLKNRIDNIVCLKLTVKSNESS